MSIDISCFPFDVSMLKAHGVSGPSGIQAREVICPVSLGS